MAEFAEFLDSWPLFYTGYLASWLIAIGLSLLGIVLVGRNQVFLSVTTAQGSSLGISLGLFLASTFEMSWLGSDAHLSLLAVLFALIFALWGAYPLRRLSDETMLGWLFLLATTASALLLAHSPHGAAEVQRLLTSSLIGASQDDLYGLAAFTFVVVVLIWRCWRTILLVTLDPRTAASSGVNINFWRWLLAGLLGIGIGLSIRVAGTLYVFACLLLPVLTTKLLVSSLRTLVCLTPAIALLTSAIGSIMGHSLDLPPAQVTVAIMVISVVCAALSVRHP